ncbi:MAG TPA: LptE family protein [Terriglobales bacterium]|nr:LptE family protein [Terriglobales bacterium]
MQYRWRDRSGSRGHHAKGGFAIWLVCIAVLLGIFVEMGCGYHVAGTSSRLPKDWSSIAIPAFKNDTTRYRIEQRFTEAVIHEFITRTKYRVVQDETGADGVLHGEILSIETSPVIFNSTTGEVETMLVTIHVRVLLVDNLTAKPVYKNDDMVFRDEYQISSDVQSFFDEQSPALGRMARDFASKLVANVVENF